MRIANIASLVLLSSLLHSSFLNGAAAGRQRPNILLIAIDDLRPEIGCYGADHVQTPRVDQLAARGLLFERTYCQQAVCNPSRTSLMTGLRPDSIGVTGNHVHFRDKRPTVVTLPQHFMNHGYHAQSIGKIYHGVFPNGASKTVWDTMGDPKSWSVPTMRFGPRYYFTENGVREAKQAYLTMYRPKNPGPDDWTQKLVFGPMTEAPDVPDNLLYDGKVADAAISVLRGFGEQPGRPFFLAVGFIKPHTPFIAPKKYFDLYDEDNISLAANAKFPDGAPRIAGHGSHEVRRYTDQPNKGPFRKGNQRRLRHAYYACTSFIDAQVGRVLDELQQQKLDDNTIVVLFGDHGWHLGEHGLWGKTTNFELDTRVPLIVYAPGMKAGGRRTKALTELVDIYPTLVEMAGLPISDELDGASFAPVLDDPDRDIKTAAFSQYPRGGNADHGGKTMGYSMRTDRWRYTDWIDRASGDVVASELYDHDNDPDETVNLASKQEHAELVTKLSRQLDGGQGWKVPCSDSRAADLADGSSSTTVFQVGDDAGSRFGYRIPALAVSKKNTILAFCERRVGLHDHAQNDIVLRRSSDNGTTFGPQIIVQEDGDNVLVNPCVVTLDSGRILLMYQWFQAGYHARAGKQMKLLDPGLQGPTVSHTLVTHSDDDGLTWSKPRDVTADTKRPNVNSTATGPGVGIVLTRGEHQGRIIMPTNEGWFEGKQRLFNVYACYSDDNGETWKNGEPAPNGSPGYGNEVQMVELSDGLVQLNSRSSGGNRLRKLAVSKDGGATWSPLKDHEQLPEPQCMGSVLRYSFSEDGKSRILYAGPSGRKGRSQGTVRISYDEGKTWPVVHKIVPGGYAYSCLTKLPGGDVGLLYESDGYRQIEFMRLPLSMLERQGRDVQVSTHTKSPARIACIGDSITFGHGIRNRGQQSYPARLQQMLGPKYKVRNFGRSGADVLAVNNGPYANTEQHRNALAFKPNIVVCNLGINDVHLLAKNKTAFVKDYTNLLQQYTSLPSTPKIYLWTELAPVMPGKGNYQNHLKLRATYAKLLRQVAENVHGEGMDMYSPLVDHTDWFPDFLHPNAEGAFRIAEVVADAIVPDRPHVALVAFRHDGSDLSGGFEDAEAGALTKLSTPLGVWSAQPGHAEIDAQHAKTGTKSLHILGGKDRLVEFSPTIKGDEALQLNFWAERWTRRPPFMFRIDQQVDGKWHEIYIGDRELSIGGFHTRVRAAVMKTESLRFRFRTTTPVGSGVLIDDHVLTEPGPLKIVHAKVEQPVLPALAGNPATAVTRLRIAVDGNTGDPPVIKKLDVNTFGTTNLADVEQVSVYYTGGNESLDVVNLKEAQLFGKSQTPTGRLEFEGQQPLSSGANYFWVSLRLKPDADLDGYIDAEVEGFWLDDGGPWKPDRRNLEGAQRLGVAVRQPGVDGVHTYRIPGLANTNKGTLIGVYDIRRRSGGDLPGDIDVGMSRSTNGGQSWEPMQVIMNMGNDPKWKYDGIGDPTVMVDRTTGAIWVAATWSHGNRSWFGSGPGLEPAETGQLMLVRSDDDGSTWSKPINITSQIKRPEWCFLLQGPGKGITMQDGTLVFPAQFQDTPENKRLPRSTIIYSRDHGETWDIGTGAFDDTTEAQVVELEPGILMLNCRYNRESRRVVATTDDMGATWNVHPTSRKALIEPRACMASLIHIDHELGSKAGTQLLFSNPNSLSGRQRMTIKYSPDNGNSWPERQQLLLDQNRSAGYSCMSMIDDDTVGIFYEGSQAHMTFQRVKLSEISK